MISILKKAIRHYGRQHQQTKAVEELAELQTAILKSLDGRCDMKNIVEEIADVEIMLVQLKKMFLIKPEELDLIKTEKILRLKRRMEVEKGLQD